jgi:hypothetical protein
MTEPADGPDLSSMYSVDNATVNQRSNDRQRSVLEHKRPPGR